jgi:2-polyprenyl-6-methoxyphenol hydroxylase-like FAD-dependent oxidoreductase
MRIAIIGAGPAGLFLGSALAGRGHDVVAVDRDPDPPPDGRWARSCGRSRSTPSRRRGALPRFGYRDQA